MKFAEEMSVSPGWLLLKNTKGCPIGLAPAHPAPGQRITLLQVHCQKQRHSKINLHLRTVLLLLLRQAFRLTFMQYGMVLEPRVAPEPSRAGSTHQHLHQAGVTSCSHCSSTPHTEDAMISKCHHEL